MRGAETNAETNAGAPGADSVRRLLSDDGRRLLAQLPPYDPDRVLSVTDRLRADGHAPDLVAAALTQSALRAKATAKFGAAAAGMFFTADGLEQATRPQIAAGHAQRFVDAEVDTVFDLGCGIGSDAVAFAAAGLRVHAVDLDPATAAIAAANAPSAVVEVADATTVSIPSDAAVWLDPARRTRGVADITGRTRRTFRLDELLPSWEFVTALGASGRAVGTKLSPSFPLSALPPEASAQWVSYGGEVLECAVWFGPLADAHRVSARLVDASSASNDVVVHTDSVAPSADSIDDVDTYLYEADRAVVRAGVTAALTDAVGGVELSPGLGHVSTDQRIDVGFARRFRVLETMPFNQKALRSWLRLRRIGRVTVKKRGVTFDDATFRRDLKLKGSDHALLLVTRLAETQVVLVLDPDD